MAFEWNKLYTILGIVNRRFFNRLESLIRGKKLPPGETASQRNYFN
jgi:hypothetical protein